MLAGHFAVALIAKRVEPKISLGTLALAAMLADLLGCVFTISGIEHVRFKPGLGAANYFDASDITMSHSLLMDGCGLGRFVRRSLFLEAALPTWGRGAPRGRPKPLATRLDKPQTR